MVSLEEEEEEEEEEEGRKKEERGWRIEAEESGKGLGPEEDEGERRGRRLQACFARTATRT